MVSLKPGTEMLGASCEPNKEMYLVELGGDPEIDKLQCGVA